MSRSIVVKTCKSDSAFERDAAKMAAGGYAVQAGATDSRSRGVRSFSGKRSQ
jgi:hypothetical protein